MYVENQVYLFYFFPWKLQMTSNTLTNETGRMDINPERREPFFK